MIARPAPDLTDKLAWSVVLTAFALLWPLANPALNQAAFLTLNGIAAGLPAVVWSDLTVFGDALAASCLLLPFLRRRPDLVLAGILASVPAAVISHAIKGGLALARPWAVLGDQVHVIGPYLKAGSFPSGHTTAAFLLACVLTTGLRTRGATPWLLVLALLAGLSRIAVGAHWPADVAGGILCGWLSGMMGLYLAARLTALHRPLVIAAVRLALIACALFLLVGYDSGYPLARPFEQALALSVLVFHLLPGWRLPEADRP